MNLYNPMDKTMRCLLIDDDLDDQEIFGMALESTDFQVKLDTADNGVKALEILEPEQNEPPDIAFLDLNMPLMSGKECLIRLRQIPHLDSMPIIIISTSSLDREQFLALGAQDFWVKSPRISELTDQLNTLFATLSGK